MVNIREDLTGVTIVRDEAGQDHILYPGDAVPAGITVGSHLTAKSSSAKPEEPASRIPPKAGPGSGAKAWREYATEAVATAGLNIEIPSDASKSDIIEALDEAQIPTE